jgi:hypothetical protein
MRKVLLIGFFLLMIAPDLPAQSIGSYLGDEAILMAQTKQVNQFFRRFNCEESPDGKRYYPGDSHYRDPDLRDRYIAILFDNENALITDPIKEDFIRTVNSGKNSIYLDFHGGEWFAEVTTKFIYRGTEMPLTLFLRLQEEEVGSKWVITNVYFEPFSKLFFNSVQNELKFLHPMSHELDFMNLIHVFKDKNEIELYTSREYYPDFLTLFIYEVKNGNLVFKTAQQVKFHFFQIPGWYFELVDFNRHSGNSGWLIANLLKINAEEKELMLKFIYHE